MLPDILFENLVVHDRATGTPSDILFLQVVAIAAPEVACCPDRFDEDLELPCSGFRIPYHILIHVCKYTLCTDNVPTGRQLLWLVCNIRCL
jgi:hypothetical protein